MLWKIPKYSRLSIFYVVKSSYVDYILSSDYNETNTVLKHIEHFQCFESINCILCPDHNDSSCMKFYNVVLTTVLVKNTKCSSLSILSVFNVLWSPRVDCISPPDHIDPNIIKFYNVVLALLSWSISITLYGKRVFTRFLLISTLIAA